MRNATPTKMPRIPPTIGAPPSCSFATIRRPKTVKPKAKPTRLIEVDIFSNRLCIFILNSGCRFGCAGGSLPSSRASSTYKGVRKPEFQEIGRIKRGFCQMPPFILFHPGKCTWIPNRKDEEEGGPEAIQRQTPGLLREALQLKR